MTSELEHLVASAHVEGIDPGGLVEIVAVAWHGTEALTLTYRDDGGQVSERIVYRADEGTFEVTSKRRAWSFDGDGARFRLAAEARRIQLAHLFDPYIALTSSQVDPYPHQIEAVYSEMLPRQPLRFLLADDPGAGKTIMAGLYMKELMLRGDAERVLIIAPGGLVTQWQDELREKFGLKFDLVTKEKLDSSYSGDVFEDGDLLIARVDQISRREDLVDRLRDVDWDLVVVDEAHRMAAHYLGAAKVKKTKRYQLGEVLGATARNLLLMTATPHAGKEEDFQLFLALLDADRFEGRFRDGVHTVDPSDLMRRMVKEKLLTFDGKKLFPERRATTVEYELSPEEMNLYDEVTAYVRDQMNRADRLAGRRGNTVGFALTLLQRRLASSPEAIFRSLQRRRKRLRQRVIDERQRSRSAVLGMSPQEERLSVLLGDDGDIDDDAFDDLDSEEREELEVEIVDAATAAETVAEIEIEIEILKGLEDLARLLCGRGVDRKWQELSGLISAAEEMSDESGKLRKLIVFTEHRDTLNYLVDRLRTFLGSHEAVVTISGGTSRAARRTAQQTFTQDKNCHILVATDAAGEGINLQQAHLVVNYDLPWNPNRIEQRFGRVHRIGQQEVCHMWNLVAADTREALVYIRLLDKIEEQRRAYKGQIFDVLGEAMSGAELRKLLIGAIRYGDDPEVQNQINEVIDATIGDRVRKAIDEAPLADETLAFADIDRIRQEMDEAAARRLQPHYIRSFFEAALAEFNTALKPRETARYEITKVPAPIRDRDRQIGRGTPVAKAYHRVTFDKEKRTFKDAPAAELLAPGHPLLRSTIDVILERHRAVLRQGTILVDENDEGSLPRVLIMLEHAIADARPSRNQPYTVVSRRFEFVEIAEDGTTVTRGYAPYLDYRPITETESAIADTVLQRDWLADDLETLGRNHAIAVAVPDHLKKVRGFTEARVEATKAAVNERLVREISYWDMRAAELQMTADAKEGPIINAEQARNRADKLQTRLKNRMTELDQQLALKPLPPQVVGGALILPIGLINNQQPTEMPEPASSPQTTKEVEDRAMAAVLAAEKHLGWEAVDMNTIQRNHPGYDIRSTRSAGPGVPTDQKFIEVKGRISGSPIVTVSRNEILTGLNEPNKFVLALVDVHPEGGETVRYLREPFRGDENIYFEMTSSNFSWPKLWERAETPS